MIKYIKIVYAAMFCMLLPCSITAHAAQPEQESKYAYLYFYTIDGEEIEKLEKKVRAEKEYTFKDPNEYRYLPQEGADGEPVYSEFYDKVKGIYWEEESDKGDLGRYQSGETATFKAGEHYFRVKSDNPALTGENLIDTPSAEHAYLYFYSAEGDSITELEKELSKEDAYTFTDPDDYVHTGENGEESSVQGKGIYWTCVDEKGKHYLFKAGDKCKFKPGDYEFYPVTDDPVTITFYYPIDVDTYLTDDHSPGEQYAQIEAIPGDMINLKKSLGAIIWENSFVGWREANFESEDKIFGGGASYQIVSNTNLDFFAVYEYDENWDLDAKDENLGAGDLDNSKTEEDIIVDVDAINQSAGAGYGAYVDANGTLRRIGNRNQINPGTKLSGIKGSIKKERWLSSLTSPNADPNDPENYTKDKYGRPFTESNLEKEMNNVLKQDDSAMYMDVYGNAFIYYRNLTREANMCLALERLQNAKTDSWVNNVQDWDSQVIKRFEAIEFAILKGKYPKEGENLFAGLDPDVTHGEELIWKSEYMSEKSYKELKPYRQIWTGWYSEYDDGLSEKYKQKSGTSGGTTVGSSGMIPGSLFGITADAAEKNSVGDSNQFGARKNNSLDFKNTQFKPQYYDPEKLYSFSNYSFSGLAGLDAERIAVLTKIFNALTAAGFSKEAAAGACGNIWQECNFNPKAGYPNKNYIGIVQWGGGRDVKLKNFATSKGKEWTDLDVQIEFMLYEIDTGYLAAMNRQLSNYNGMKNIKAVDNAQIACDIWAAAMEGCVCSVSSHSIVECPMVNGKKYQELRQRREYSQKVYNAMTMTSGILGGSFVGKSNQEIIGQIFPGLSSVGTMDLNPDYTKAKMEKNYIVSAPAPGYGTLRVNKYIADDVTAIFTELERINFPIEQAAGYSYRGISNNGKGYYQIGSGKMSYHASGLAVDINWAQNPYIKLGASNSAMQAAYKPGKDPKAITLDVYHIFKSHGLLWGRDFSNCYDIMHFSLAEVSKDGRNAHVSNICAGQ